MAESRPIRVVLVDDHRHIHTTITSILAATQDISLVGQGASGLDALRLCKDLHPDLVLMDVVMPDLDGIQATAQIQEHCPQVKVLVLSSFQDHESVHAMLKNGAAGYIVKSTLSQDLVDTIRAVCQGKAVFSMQVAAHFAKDEPPKTDFGLTDREIEVLTLLAQGLNMVQIGEKLFISQSTVKFHTSNICNKLGAQSRSEALVIAAKNKLI